MNIPDAITELGRQIGLPSLSLNDAGLCRVVFDTTLVVDLESMNDGRTLHLSAVVAPLDTDVQGEGFYAALLEANLLGVATGGAHFSISMADQEVLFERALDMEGLDFTGFSQAVESFVNHLEGWKEKLDGLDASVPLATDDLSAGFVMRA